MPAPSITLTDLRKLAPCKSRFDAMSAVLPKRGKITAAEAVALGATLDDLVWVASAVARQDADVERRLRLWMADCAARVLHIYEKEKGADDRPRKAIIAARQFARGEIEDTWAAWDAAARAAWDAAAKAASFAARAAAWAAASFAAARAAKAATFAASFATWASRDSEMKWQLDRLVARLSADEPQDWPLPEMPSHLKETSP